MAAILNFRNFLKNCKTQKCLYTVQDRAISAKLLIYRISVKSSLNFRIFFKNVKQDHCRGVYLPPSIKGEEIPFLKYSHFSFSAKIQDGRQKWRKLKFFS